MSGISKRRQKKTKPADMLLNCKELTLMPRYRHFRAMFQKETRADGPRCNILVGIVEISIRINTYA
jgi:hypothetical protein